MGDNGVIQIGVGCIGICGLLLDLGFVADVFKKISEPFDGCSFLA